jgi:SAM-dependent methyltransferase
MIKKYPTIQDKKKLYNTYASLYQKRTSDFTKLISLDYQIFFNNLPGKKILDVGCGPGRDSSVFKKRGFQPLCLDISEEMLKLCRAKGLKTLQMNIEKLAIGKNRFDGIWSYTCFTTIPKNKVWKILNTRIHKAIKKDGLLFLGLIEGDFEGWKKPDQKYALARYTSRYQTKEVIEKLQKKFQLVYFRRISFEESGRNTYLNFLFKKL